MSFVNSIEYIPNPIVKYNSKLNVIRKLENYQLVFLGKLTKASSFSKLGMRIRKYGIIHMKEGYKATNLENPQDFKRSNIGTFYFKALCLSHKRFHKEHDH